MPAEDLQLGRSVEEGEGKQGDLTNAGEPWQCMHDMSDTE